MYLTFEGDTSTTYCLVRCGQRADWQTVASPHLINEPCPPCAVWVQVAPGSPAPKMEGYRFLRWNGTGADYAPEHPLWDEQ